MRPCVHTPLPCMLRDDRSATLAPGGSKISSHRSANRAVFLASLLAALPLACQAAIRVGAEEKVSVTLHEPVIAPLVLWNDSSAPVEVNVGQSSEESYRITITRPNGERVTAGKPLWAQGPSALAGVKKATVAPGQSYTRSLLLNEWATFDRPGIYGVLITLPGAAGVASFEVEILPRDESRLRDTCERLDKDRRERHSEGDIDPMRALSFVADDVAIPYLVEIASTEYFGTVLGIEGLVRVGDLQAVSALASFPQGRAGLMLLLGSSSSEPVKAAARDALARSSPN